MSELQLSAGAHAFGDGSHPTTAGVLAAIEGIKAESFAPRCAIDIGAGSGIISFAIVQKFRCPVVAVDIEKTAVATITENACANGVKVSLPHRGRDGMGALKATAEPDNAPLLTSPLQGGELLPIHADGFDHPDIASRAPYDLMVMNILAEPLLRLARTAEQNLAQDGVLILSGILQWQEAQISEAYTTLGLELSVRLVVGDWVTLVWQKPTSAT